MSKWRRDLPVTDRAILGALDRIERALKTIAIEELIQMATLQDVKDAVANNTTVTGSAVVAINKLADKLQEVINAGADPAALQELVDVMRSDDTNLATAIAARTPAENEPAPPPVEPGVQPE